MRTRIFTTALALALLALFTQGCEDTITVATDGSSIILAASPSNIEVLDAQGNGTSNITATVLNVNGIPQRGVTVFFSTNAGTLASAADGGTDETNDNGVATDLLTTSQSALVTAQSGSAMSQVTITVSGRQLVDTVTLTALDPTSGMSPLSVRFQALVQDTFGDAIQGQAVTVTLFGDGIVNPLPPIATDAFGIALFTVSNITVDTTVIANAGGVSSEEVFVTIQ